MTNLTKNTHLRTEALWTKIQFGDTIITHEGQIRTGLGNKKDFHGISN